VQDQHFCINCGQMVPEPESKIKESNIKVESNGLPEGVKILPVQGSGPEPLAAVPDPDLDSAPTEPEPASTEESQIVKPRVRIGGAESEDSNGKGKKRLRGRPKAGKLDVPKELPKPGSEPLPPAPLTATKSEPVSIKKMSDITFAKSKPEPAPKPAAEPKPEKPVRQPKQKAVHHSLFTPKKPKRPAVHHPSVPPIHYGAVLGFTFRSRFQLELVAIMAVSAAVLAAVAGFGAWLLVTGRLDSVARHISRPSAVPIAELVLLACLYYIGRSVGQSAIVYGVAREEDHRPITLSRQLGVGINTFSKRLSLDLVFLVLELLVIAGVVALVLVGGSNWPVNPQIQVGALFFAFLILLYLASALAISRGLGSVILTLTGAPIAASVKEAWRLFSHRFELLAFKFFALAFELLLAAPFVILGAALVVASPASLHIPAAIGVALLAWVAGAMLGVGTAAWWSSLYRRLIEIDRPEDPHHLLASRVPQEASRSGLAVLVSLTTLLITLSLALPWLKIS
jgi:hypothetical protein